MNQVSVHCVVLLSVGFAFALAQQIDSVDLTRPAPPEKSYERPLPVGCDKLTEGIIGDGFTEPEDHKRRHIVVEVLAVNNKRPALGGEVEATLELHNADTHPVEVPWSIDPNVIEEGQRPDDLQWEGATFEFNLTNEDGERIALKSLTQWLHGSKFLRPSRIGPGQSVTALVKFKLQALYPSVSARLQEGEWHLSAQWHQVGRSLRIKDCRVSNGFFQYDNFYEQENTTLRIQIVDKSPDGASSKKKQN